jgi:hypothetical protein
LVNVSQRIPVVWPSSPSFAVRNFSDVDGPKQRQVKVKRKDKRKDKSDGGRSRELGVILAALDAKKVSAPELAPDEMDRRLRISREYTIGMFKRHNENEHDLQCKIHLKKHAMNMLPKDSFVAEGALKIDDEGPPRWRNIPAWTPSIPGFEADRFMTTEE